MLRNLPALYKLNKVQKKNKLPLLRELTHWILDTRNEVRFYWQEKSSIINYKERIANESKEKPKGKGEEAKDTIECRRDCTVERLLHNSNKDFHYASLFIMYAPCVTLQQCYFLIDIFQQTTGLSRTLLRWVYRCCSSEACRYLDYNRCIKFYYRTLPLRWNNFLIGSKTE